MNPALVRPVATITTEIEALVALPDVPPADLADALDVILHQVEHLFWGLRRRVTEDAPTPTDAGDEDERA